MNEIDPANSNGSISENHQETLQNKSTPLLSSLLVSTTTNKQQAPHHDASVSNGGQQEKRSVVHDLIMSSSSLGAGGVASAIVTNPQYEKKISPKRSSVSSRNPETTVLKEFDLDLSGATTNINSNLKKYNNLNDLLQRNNNNSETTTKSILENCLLKPSIKSNRLESQYYHQQQQHNFNQSKMDETGSSPSASSLLKFAQPEESRKVEPLKINLNREPIRTVIKLPPNNVFDSPTKITIKSPQPPPTIERNANLSTGTTTQSISPTLSSSSSLSSESSYEHYNDIHHRSNPSSIQVVPKLHLRSLLDNTPHEQSELHIVPKLTITGLNSSQTLSSLSQQQQQQQQQDSDHSVNSILETPSIPKLTLKKDNKSSNELFYHLNHEVIPKLHIKTLNHHYHHHNTTATSSTQKLKALDQLPPPVPKLTIKTSENDTLTVINSSHDTEQQQQAAIPKILIKANQQTPKLTIKPLVRPSVPSINNDEDEEDDDDEIEIIEQPPQQLSSTSLSQQEESIPKLTLKAVHNNSSTRSSDSPTLTFEKVVPKLVVKLPKDKSTSKVNEDNDKDDYEGKESSSSSSTPSPPLTHVSKLNIKPLPFPEKEVPKQQQQHPAISSNDLEETLQKAEVKFSIDRLRNESEMEIEEEEEDDDEEEDEVDEGVHLKSKPLEINTSAIKSADSGLDSPRIILKINKTNNESITTEIIQPIKNENNLQQKLAAVNSNKRAHSNDPVNHKNNEEDDDDVRRVEEKKKLKLVVDEDVILINDSDASSEASNHLNKNHQKNHSSEANHNDEFLRMSSPAVNNEMATPMTTKSARSLRQSRRNIDVKKQSPLKNAILSEPPPPPPPQPAPPSIIREDSQTNSIDPLALDATANNSNSVDEIVTPKRGRGRPKKIVQQNEKSVSSINSESRDPLEIAADETNGDEKNPFASVSIGDEKKTPSRGRGRGRGRLKRTIEVMKNGKSVQITLDGHDDDDSPSFSLYNRNTLRGGLSKRSRGGKTMRGGKQITKVSTSPFVTPERSKDGIFTSPSFNNDFKDLNRRKIFNTPSIFEEDTRMSIGGDSSQTPLRSFEMHSNEESQSSILSSTSNTVEGSAKKRSKKMEVCEPEGRMEFTIDLLAEYEWPQSEPSKSRDTFMIQEQIAEYLGIKSFKRKYPDLMRRPVEMEERNFLFENGLASEKMCDLGLTAVYGNEILDIMCNDYPEKYEEYKRYQREKAFRNARLRLETAVIDRSQMQKDKAISSASDFNSRFNKDRRENRRCCMDLQNFLIQKPTPVRDYKVTPSATYRSAYPAALVPGQFSEYYEKYTPEQLACYPINTILVDFNKLEQYMANNPNPYEFSDDSSDSSDEGDDDGSTTDGSSSDSDSSDNESSSGDDYEDPKCRVCSQTPFKNRFNQPEKFIKCTTCKHEAHPSCIEMSQRMFVRSLAYKWQCSHCKSCGKCGKQKDNKMLFCIQCDRGYHIYCLGLRNVPEGQYHCVNCTICSECGAKSPEGHFNAALSQQQRQDLAMIAQWNHEFTTNPLTNIREHKASSCLPCYRKINQKKTEE